MSASHIATSNTGLWFQWLRVTLVALGVLGAAMVFAPGVTKIGFSWMIYFDPAYVDATYSAAAVDYMTLIYGVLGAIMVGWSVLLLAVLHGPFARGDYFGWLAIAASLGIWFLLDTTFSAVTGYWQNVVLNTVFGVAMAIPLVATFNRFRSS